MAKSARFATCRQCRLFATAMTASFTFCLVICTVRLCANLRQSLNHLHLLQQRYTTTCNSLTTVTAHFHVLFPPFARKLCATWITLPPHFGDGSAKLPLRH